MEKYYICSLVDTCDRECDHKVMHIITAMCGISSCHGKDVKCVLCINVTKEEEKIIDEIRDKLVDIIINN